MDVTLPLACRTCGVLLNVEILDFNHGAKLNLETITCPACNTRDRIAVPGHIATVTLRPKVALPDAS